MRRDAGFTLIELLVAVSLLLLAIGLFSSALVVVQRNVGRQLDRGENLASARLALVTMDAQVRSGFVASLGDSNRRAVIYTEAEGKRRCVGWLVYPASGEQSLYTATWNAGSSGPAAPGGWDLVAEGIRNADPTINVAPFSARLYHIGTSPARYVGLSLGVQLWVSNRASRDPVPVATEATRIASTFTARNLRRAALTMPSGLLVADACK